MQLCTVPYFSILIRKLAFVKYHIAYFSLKQHNCQNKQIEPPFGGPKTQK